MSYRVLSAPLQMLTSKALLATAKESGSFSALCEVLAWAARGNRESLAVVVVEEGRGRPLHTNTAEDAARSVV